MMLWYAYLIGLLVAGAALIIFPPKRRPIRGIRDRAVIAAICGITLGFAIPPTLLAPWSLQARLALLFAISILGVPVLAAYSLLRGVYLNYHKSRMEREYRAVTRTQGVAALTAFQEGLTVQFPYMLRTLGQEQDSVLCMDAHGSFLRVLQLAAPGGEVERLADVTLAVSDIVSVDLIRHEQVYTQSTTVTRKKGAIGRAVAGELMFGGVGALVGAVSAGSTSATVGQEQRVYQSSELVFGLADLANPVLRFFHDDHAEADRWLHRIRSAMARAKANPQSAAPRLATD